MIIRDLEYKKVIHDHDTYFFPESYASVYSYLVDLDCFNLTG